MIVRDTKRCFIKKYLLLPPIALFLVFSPGCGGGSSSDSGGSANVTATVIGTLKNKVTGAPMTSITVTLQGSSNSTLSDSEGKFELLGIKPGSHTLTFTDSYSNADGSEVISVSGTQTDLGAIQLDAEGNPPSIPPLVRQSDSNSPLIGAPHA